MRKMIGMTIVLIILFATIALSGKIEYFIDIPSILFVVLIVAATLIAKFPIKELIKGLKTPHYQLARTATIIAGVLGPFIGGIALLNSPLEGAKLKAAFSISLLTLFYSLILYLIFHILDRE